MSIVLSRHQYDNLVRAASFAQGMSYPGYRPRRRPFIGSRGKWSGVVVFDSERGLRTTTVSGTPTGFLLIHVSDALKPSVEYCDGTQLEAWPDGCVVRQLVGVVGDIYVG